MYLFQYFSSQQKCYRKSDANLCVPLGLRWKVPLPSFQKANILTTFALDCGCYWKYLEDSKSSSYANGYIHAHGEDEYSSHGWAIPPPPIAKLRSYLLFARTLCIYDDETNFTYCSYVVYRDRIIEASYNMGS